MQTIHNLICDFCGTDFTRASTLMSTGGRKNSTHIFCTKDCYDQFQM